MTSPRPTTDAGPVLDAPRRAYRSTDGRLLGGVASGLAEHLGVPVLWVRAGFLVMVAFSGLGAFLYAGLWLVLPARRDALPGTPGLDAATRQGKRGGRRERKLADYGPLVAIGAIAVGALLLVIVATGQTLAVGPLLLGAGGIAVLWWQADQAQRDRWSDTTARINPLRAVVGGGGWAAYLRIGAGLLMLVTAIMLFSLRSGSFAVALNVGLAAALAILGLGLMVGPWLVRLSSDLSEERVARVRSEERADIAAHLHDSVLQTLALIQRNAAVAARGRAAGARARSASCAAGSTATAAGGRRRSPPRCGASAAEVEDALRRAGRRGRGRRRAARRRGSTALVLAAREAMVNAAQALGGRRRSSVYAEVDAGRRRGVRARPRRRLRPRRGRRRPAGRARLDHRPDGSATAAPRTIRSRPGEGTEVRPRDARADDRRDRMSRAASSSSTTTRMFRAGVRAELGAARVEVVGEAATSPRRSPSIARAPRPTWCCSTCTCPAAAGRA